MQLVGDYHDEVDASLQFACAPRDPIAQCMKGKISLRMLGVLIANLPADSSAAIARRGNPWMVTDWLLREVDSELRILNAAIYNLTRQEGRPAITAELIPRPEENESIEDALEAVAEREQHARTKAEMDAHIARIFVND